jgi:phosphomannomutase
MPCPPHSTPELNVACAEGEPHALVEQLLSLGALRGARQVSTIDGCGWTGPTASA